MKNRDLLAALLILAASAVQAANYRLDPDRSSLTFKPQARFGDGSGKFASFDVRGTIDPQDVSKAKLTVNVDVASIDTGIKKRDKHLRSADFFDVESYPIATLSVTAIAPASPQQYDVTGEFALKDVKKTIPLTATVNFEGGGVRIKGGTTIKRKEFHIDYDSKLNPIKDEVEIAYDLMLILDEPAAPAKASPGVPANGK